MFGALMYLADDAWQTAFVAGLAVLQLLEGRAAFFATFWGRALSVSLQLLLGFLLVGISGGIQSPYYLVLLLPIVSNAIYLGVTGTVVLTLAASGVYLSFLLFVDWRNQTFEPEALHILAIRCLLPAVAAVLVNSLAEAVRTQSARYKTTAEQLADANKNLREAEAAVRRADRLAALGQLSAGLAHELRNPLGSIKGSAELLARSTAAANPVTQELAAIISSEVDRTNSLVTRFLDFARPLQPRLQPADLKTVIDHAVEFAKVPVTRHDAPLPAIPMDPELMRQVFLNLITNAAQASAPGSHVIVETKQTAHHAEIAVIDHGCGIPSDTLETIFNPFVTTKPDGIGLGLAIVSNIVDSHGGKITVESEPGKGSTFRVLLPLTK